MEKHSISRNSYPPKHLCCENIDAARATGNFQYSRKLELLNFLWWDIVSSFKVIMARNPHRPRTRLCSLAAALRTCGQDPWLDRDVFCPEAGNELVQVRIESMSWSKISAMLAAILWPQTFYHCNQWHQALWWKNCFQWHLCWAVIMAGLPTIVNHLFFCSWLVSQTPKDLTIGSNCKFS